MPWDEQLKLKTAQSEIYSEEGQNVEKGYRNAVN